MDANQAFDTAEGLNVLAHDYGLYAVKTELDRLGFRAGISRDTLEGIDEEGREVYATFAPLAETSDPYTVPEWADSLLTQIRDASDTDS